MSYRVNSIVINDSAFIEVPKIYFQIAMGIVYSRCISYVEENGSGRRVLLEEKIIQKRIHSIRIARVLGILDLNDAKNAIDAAISLCKNMEWDIDRVDTAIADILVCR